MHIHKNLMATVIKNLIDIARRRIIFVILLLGLINGLVYVFVVPPWGHYDEPGHFEYAWLIANRLKIPDVGDYDQAMRLAVGQSLIETKFFERSGASRPNLTDPSQPLWIGASQIEDPPLYYVLTALPLHLLQEMPINWQLYSGRMVSLLFLLITIYSAYKVTSELTPEGHPLGWLVPIFISLLPAFVEFMTALNNYPAAIGLTSLWLLSAVRLIKYKWSIKQAIILLALTIACVFTQKAVLYIVIFIPFILLISLLPRGREWTGWVFIITVGVVGFASSLDWNDAAFWLRRNSQDFTTRTTLTKKSGFQFALQGKVYPDQFWGGFDPAWHSGFFQLVPTEISNQLKNRQVTVGAWIWTDQIIRGYGPGINALYQFQDKWYGFEPTVLSSTPKFVASVITVPWEQDRIQIWLRTTSQEAADTRIYFSGIVLAEGAMPVDVPPRLADDGSGGVWAGKPFKNLARNSLITQVSPYFRPEIANLMTKKVSGITPTTISSFIALFYDNPGTSWYIKGTAERIFRTFWATFGWGQVTLYKSSLYPRPYLILLILTLIGIAGSLVSMNKIYKPYPTEVFFLVILMSTTILVAYFYGVYTMGGALRFRAYLPVARYIFPAIVPISLVLVTGWHGIVAVIVKKIKLSPQLFGVVWILFLVLLDGYSIFSNIKYYSEFL